MNREGVRKNIWQEEIKKFPASININTVYDVAIVGGGITCISAALRLQKSGKECVLLETFNIGFGTTGGTTAHLNNFYDTTYAEALSKFGLENAKLLAKSAEDAMKIIGNDIRENNISCDFEKKSAQLFALDDKQKKQLDDILEGSEKAGHTMTNIDRISFPVPFTKAVEIPGQGQFHPIKYITSLGQVFLNSGGTIVENCRCESHSDEDDFIILNTSKGIIKAKNVIYATHIPPGISRLHFTNSPYRSYVIAFT